MATSSDNLCPEVESVDPEPWRWSWPARLGFVGAGVVSPLICFSTAAVSGIPLFKPWQSGDFRMYAGLLLSEPESFGIFIPFLLYSMTSLMLVTFRPHRFGQVFVVRVGVYTGVVLAIQYAILMVLYLSFDPALIIASSLAIGIPLGVGGAIHLVARKFGRKRVWLSATAIALIIGIVWLLVSLPHIDEFTEVLQAIFGVPFLLCLFFGTPWAVAAYSIMSIALVRRFASYRPQMSLLRLMGVISLISVYMAAWRVSINQMLEGYASLPLSQPSNCYICTAAARGHAAVVKHDVVRNAAGETIHVNDQMRTLKCAELILRHFFPSLHRTCRVIYDSLGPPLAGLLVHPLLADAAYLALKPSEWVAQVILKIVLPRHSDVMQRIY